MFTLQRVEFCVYTIRCNHRVRRSDSSSVSLRKNQQRPCVTHCVYRRSNYCGLLDSPKIDLLFTRHFKCPRKNVLRLISFSQYGVPSKRKDLEIQCMEREESRSNWIHKHRIGQMTWLYFILPSKMLGG